MSGVAEGLGKLFDMNAKQILENQKLRDEVNRLNLQNGVWVDLLREAHSGLHSATCAYDTIGGSTHTALCRKIESTMRTWATISNQQPDPTQNCNHDWQSVDPESAHVVIRKCRKCDLLGI